jgi:type I restriction enzyme, S subunit
LNSLKQGYKREPSIYQQYEEIPKDWDFVSISETGKIYGGGTPKTTKPEYWENGDIPWFTPTELTKLESNFVEDSKRKITKKGLDESGAKIIPENNILITTRATIGNCVINNKKSSTNQGFQNLIVNKNHNNKFLMYSIQFNKRRLRQYSQGTTFLEISKTNFAKIKIPCPRNPKEEEKIGAILSNIDELIQKQQQVIEQTEKLMKGQMQNLLTKGIGHSEINTAQLIPRWNKSKKPKNWKVVKLSDIGEIITGTTPSTLNLEFYGSDHTWVTPEDMDYKTKFVSNSKTQLTKNGFDNVRQIPKKSILFVCIGSTISKIAIAEKKMSTNQQINSLVCNDDQSEFVYYQLLFHSKKIKTLGGTNAVPIINKTDFGKYEITIPTDKDEEEKIGAILSNIDSAIQQEKQYKEKLENLKRGLMQQLLTGEKRVKI